MLKDDLGPKRRGGSHDRDRFSLVSPRGLVFLFFLCWGTTAVAAGPYLLNPPTETRWAYADIVPQPDTKNKRTTELCQQYGKILVTRSQQFATSELSDDALQRYEILVDRLTLDYEEASPRERLSLAIGWREFIDAYGISNLRQVTQAWIQVDSQLVHFISIVDLATHSRMVKFEDLTTGIYLGFVDLAPAGGDNMDLILELLDAETAEKGAAIAEELSEIGKGRIFRFEVNGVAFYRDGSSGLTYEMANETSALWDDLAKTGGKLRLAMAMQVLFRAMVDEDFFSMIEIREWFTGALKTEDAVLHCAPGLHGVSRIDRPGNFEAPPEDVLQDFFGKPSGFPMPDANRRFKEILKKIM